MKIMDRNVKISFLSCEGSVFVFKKFQPEPFLDTDSHTHTHTQARERIDDNDWEQHRKARPHQR